MRAEEVKQVEELNVVTVELPIEWDDVKEFRDTGVIVSIKPPKNARKNKQSIALELKAPIRRGDISLLNYICDALLRKNPSLIPFVWNNESVRLLARHYHIHKTSSVKTLQSAVFFLNSFSEFTGMQPDLMIRSMLDSEGNVIQKAVKKLKEDIEEWMAELKAMEYAPGSIKLAVSYVKSWLDINGVEIGKLPKPQGYVKYSVKAFTNEEIRKMIDVADLQGKVIISILATSGMRIGTLAKLKYKHVKEDLEAGRVPVCIHIKADETKGKYADYFTFINEEAVEYLKLYLERRRRGSESGKIPPEEINDESPLIRDSRSREVKPVQEDSIYAYIHRLMQKAGIIRMGTKKRYELNVHSFRKWFKTQMTAKGVQPDYIEFMMGHVVSTYQDVKSLGVEELRRIYRKADLRIRAKPEISKLEQLKALAESLGLDPEKVINTKAIVEPHRTVIGEDSSIKALQEAIRDTLTKLVLERSKELNLTPD